MAKVSVKKKLQYWGTGRRKSAVARVRLIPGGTGAININGRSIDEYCDLDTLKLIIRQPLVLTETDSKYDVFVNVNGGGFTGQAGAVTASQERLSLRNPNFAPPLRKKVISREIRE